MSCIFSAIIPDQRGKVCFRILGVYFETLQGYHQYRRNNQSAPVHLGEKLDETFNIRYDGILAGGSSALTCAQLFRTPIISRIHSRSLVGR
nr:MAG TPA: hypothetical protein [Caudoviricetes sp.]